MHRKIQYIIQAAVFAASIVAVTYLVYDTRIQLLPAQQQNQAQTQPLSQAISKTGPDTLESRLEESISDPNHCSSSIYLPDPNEYHQNSNDSRH